jgi:hypothetical protein
METEYKQNIEIKHEENIIQIPIKYKKRLQYLFKLINYELVKNFFTAKQQDNNFMIDEWFEKYNDNNIKNIEPLKTVTGYNSTKQKMFLLYFFPIQNNEFFYVELFVNIQEKNNYIDKIINENVNEIFLLIQ